MQCRLPVDVHQTGMKKEFGPGMFAAAAITIAGSLYGANSVPGVPVSVLVTVESKGPAKQALSKDEIRVQENRQDRAVSDIKPADSSKLQLLIMVDDSAGGSFDTQIPDLKKFVSSLPANADVGVGYMRNGMTQMVSNFTSDHEKAANTIRLPQGAGGADVSPYDSLSDAIKKWPASDGMTRREVIMISSGIEGLGGGLPPENPYVNAGIRDAQKAGVVVYAIYNPSFGHSGHSLWQANRGQDFLSQLADETGGELYWVGFGSAVSFEPYFADILKRLTEQYVVTFEANAEKKAGLQPIKISSTQKGISIAAPDKVYVKASM